MATLTHESGVCGQISLNYFRPTPRRSFEIVFSNGLIEGDLLTGDLRWSRRNGVPCEERFQIQRDELHDLQSEAIFSALEGKTPNPWDLKREARLIETVLELR